MARAGRSAGHYPTCCGWPGTFPLALPPLDEEAVGRYLGAGAGSADEVRALHRRSGGNPLFLRALTWTRVPAPSWVVPGSELRSVVRATLAALPPATLDLVDASAVLGEDVAIDVLAGVTGRLPARVATTLDAAVAAGVLTAVPDAPGRRRFLHAVVRDAVYEDLSPSTREELHRRAAEALERLVPADAEAAGMVAGHWLRAAPDAEGLRRAATWSRRAAAAATRSLAFEDAARFLTSAVELAARTGAGDAERAELLLELATAEFRAGRFAQGLDHAASVSGLATGLDRPDLLAGAALVVHDVAAPGFAATQQHLCERALAAVGHEPVVRARLLAQLASVLADIGRSAASSEHSAEALVVAERCGDPEALLDAARARMKASGQSLAVEERMRLGLLAIEHSGTAGQPLAALWGAKWRIDAALESGDMPVVEEELARVTELAARTRLPLVRWHDVRLRASVAALLGRFPEALALNEEARALAATQLAQDPSAVGMSSAFLQQHNLVTGGFTELDGATAAVLERAPTIPVVLVSRVLWAVLRGDADRATALYDGMRAALAGTDFLSAVGVAVNLVPLVEFFADVATAERLADSLRARRYAAAGAGIYCTGSSAELLGRLAVLLGRTDEALVRFEEALDTDTRTGARPATVHDRLGLGGALLSRGQPADLARARELARSALAEGRRLGMPGPVARAAALLETVTMALRSADPLTEREREIAGLVAAALTNRQIAERLVLSERTVESHVRHILGKLGLANRTELATAVLGARGG